MDNFGRYVAVVLVVGIAFLMPIVYLAEQLSEIQRLYIIESGEAFIEKVNAEKKIYEQVDN